MKNIIMPFFSEQKFKDVAEEKQSGECTVKGYTVKKYTESVACLS